ncbi:unnamed protein product [Oikopleura dioica]|nr:unnamed protein product [Oikopleura dioica]CBY39136.1 unnamed protein product [Oikopleura dioica]
MRILVFLFFEQSKEASVWSGVGSGDDSVCGDSYQLYVSQWILDNTQLTTDRDYAYYNDYDYNDDELEEANDENAAEAAKNLSVACGVPMFADEAERTPTCAVLSDQDEEHIVDTSRILGANEAIPHSHPWLAALQIRKSKRHFCSGSILNSRWIITAQHCRFNLEKDEIVVGAHKRDRSDSSDGEFYQAEEKVDHPLTTAARGGIQDFDISLLKTKKAIVFSSKVVPICLATSPPDRDSCFFAGWGRTVAMPPQYPDNLLETHIQINNNCGPFDLLLNEHSFCAGYNGTSSGCVGDSGGPLVCARSSGNMNTRFEISGVSSWSGQSCYPANPTGFMKGPIRNKLKSCYRFSDFHDLLFNRLKVYSKPILDFIQRIISNI